jgi:hypothetical protein
LAECDPLARILFAGFWCEADRDGFLALRPKKIKATILPYDDCDVVELIGQLLTMTDPVIEIHEVDGREYVEVLNFKKHQNPHKNEKASEIKELIESREKARNTPVITGAVSEKYSTTPADSLIPDSLIPDSLITDSQPGSDEDGKFYTLKELNALAVKYLGWRPAMTAGTAESLRVLTEVPKEDAERGFKAASENGSKSVNYVIAAAVNKKTEHRKSGSSGPLLDMECR